MKSLIFCLFFAFIGVGTASMIEDVSEEKFDLPGASFTEFNKSECACRLEAKSRIVDGKIAPHNIPWQVSLGNYDEHYCSGIIINNYYILTAAHCVLEYDPSNVTVRAGSRFLNEIAFNSTIYNVDKFIMFNPVPKRLRDGTLDNDIALIKLKERIHFVKGKISPACLNTKVNKTYDSLMASGWGTTEKTIKVVKTDVLRYGNLSSVLKEAYFFEDKLGFCKDNVICVNSPNEDSICDGDSGGPLHSTVNGITTVEGLISKSSLKDHGKGEKVSCFGNATFVRLTAYKEWIENLISDNYCN